MATSTLAQIKKKVRRLTGSPSPSQLSESDLEEYIDTFYDQDLPSHLKLWNLHDKLTFFTVPNEDEYLFNTTLYHGMLPPVYIDGYQSFFSQSRQEFFRIWPQLSSEFTGPVGDASTGPYTFTLPSLPVEKRQVTISALDNGGISRIVEDLPQAASQTQGDLVDPGVTAITATNPSRGIINYVTGVVTGLTFTAAIPTTSNIIARYHPYKASRPAGMLFFDDTIKLRPIPDKVYRVEIDVYSRPSQLLSADSHASTNTPDVNQWWQYVALGAAIKVLQDRQDVDSIQNIMPFFKEQEALVMYRTALQMAPERTATIYTDQLQFPAGNRNFGGN